MNRVSLLSTGLAALALMVSACSQSSSPTSALGIGAESETDQAGILAKLQDPQVSVWAAPQEQTGRIQFTAGASGTSESESIRATREIVSVDFEIYEPGGDLIDRTTTTNVYTSGVRIPGTYLDSTSDGGPGIVGDAASLTVTAEASPVPRAMLDRAGYVIGIVHGRNGERLVVRADAASMRSS